ncbi:MAG TPA: hypothetical protein VHE12_13830 [bacterium]|nr:hypothetical protein [bacterium]
MTHELERLVQIYVESGNGTIAQGKRFYKSLTLEVHLSPNDSATPAGQAAALTAIATAVRCFLGGVELTGDTSQKLLLPLKFKTVGEAAKALGGRTNIRAQRTVIIGSALRSYPGWTVRAWWDGWVAGVRAGTDTIPSGKGLNVLSGIAAGNLAVSEAFQHAIGNPRAGLKARTLSLWNPSDPTDVGEDRVFLPEALWFLGLGNLGQSYLWSLILLPFNNPSGVRVVLQDFDFVQPPNLGTSILTSKKDFGRRKGALVGDWVLARKFTLARYDRRFDETFHRQDGEPTILISGLDSLKVRKKLGGAGFDFIIDAGLGNSALTYHQFRLNVFYDEFQPEEHFRGQEDDENARVQKKLALPVYQRELTGNAKKDCGVAEIAGASVAAPFVSGLAGAFVISQAIRISSNQNPFISISGSVLNDPIVTATEGKKAKVKYPGYSEPMAC